MTFSAPTGCVRPTDDISGTHRRELDGILGTHNPDQRLGSPIAGSGEHSTAASRSACEQRRVLPI